VSYRLAGLNCSRPYYYMVELRRLEGLAALPAIDETGLRI